MSEEKKNKLRVAYGPVSLVKAIPSREVSVIYIEVPEEFHVEVTNMLYGRDALITLSTLKGVSYGVLDPESNISNEIQAESSQESHTEIQVSAVHGKVCTVKAVASRGVSVITVEVPEDAHVDVTQMLYGREVLVMPVSLGLLTPYGIVNGSGKGVVHKINPRAGTASPTHTNIAAHEKPIPLSPSPYPQRTTHSNQHPANSMIRLPQPLDILRWLSVKCAEDEFQSFLNVRNEAQAIDSVRTICVIESRKELRTNQEAKNLFMSNIYLPFTTQKVKV